MNLSFSQIKTAGEVDRPDCIEFIDTTYGFVTDSLKHNLGDLTATFEYDLIKYFKDTGPDTISIERTWTTDPHIICDYPRGALTNEAIYSFKACFALNHTGHFYKTMGFILSNGKKITFTFQGNVISNKEIP